MFRTICVVACLACCGAEIPPIDLPDLKVQLRFNEDGSCFWICVEGMAKLHGITGLEEAAKKKKGGTCYREPKMLIRQFTAQVDYIHDPQTDSKNKSHIISFIRKSLQDKKGSIATKIVKDKKGKILGGHAVVIVGESKRGFRYVDPNCPFLTSTWPIKDFEQQFGGNVISFGK